MPVKFKPSASIVVNRAAKKYRTAHYYMKDTSTKELEAVFYSSGAKPKQKQKCKNELVARGVL
jgi:hypothetical protein